MSMSTTRSVVSGSGKRLVGLPAITLQLTPTLPFTRTQWSVSEAYASFYRTQRLSLQRAVDGAAGGSPEELETLKQRLERVSTLLADRGIPLTPPPKPRSRQAAGVHVRPAATPLGSSAAAAAPNPNPNPNANPLANPPAPPLPTCSSMPLPGPSPSDPSDQLLQADGMRGAAASSADISSLATAQERASDLKSTVAKPVDASAALDAWLDERLRIALATSSC